MHVFTAMKTFSSFRSALWVLLYRKSLATSAALLCVVWYVIGHVFCFIITSPVVSYSSHWPCLLFYYTSCCCITRHSPCLHSLHLLGGTEENDWYPVNLARIWTWDLSYTRRECYFVAIFDTELEEFTDKNIWSRPKFPCLLYVLSHLLVARLILSGDIPSLFLYIFITCMGIILRFFFAFFTELNGTVF